MKRRASALVLGVMALGLVAAHAVPVPAVAVVPSQLSISAIAASYTQTVSLAIASTGSDPVIWTASCPSNWLSFATRGTTPATLNVCCDIGKLSAGTYSTAIVIGDGAGSVSVPVTIQVEKMRIVKMATDWTKPYVYLAHTSDVSPYKSRLVWYNTGTDRIELVLDAGENATDLTVHYGDDRIYVSNWQRAETRVFDRSAKRELAPLLLGGDVYKLNALGPGRVCCEGMDQWISVSLRGTADGSVKASLGITREGDGEGTADGRLYYRCDNNISNAQLYKYAVTNDAFERTASVRTRSYYGSRNVVVSMDGSRVYNCGAVYDAGLRELLYLGSEIYAASAYGDLVVTGSKAVNGVSGAEVGTLPFSTSVMAFSGDQSKLLLFNAAAGSVTSLATSVLMPLPRPGLIPAPADGSVQGANLPSLSWSAAPGATGYNVYLGTDADAVAAAGTNSPESLGRLAGTSLQLQPGTLAGNTRYFWRVDMVGFGGAVVPGAVWSFRTAAIAVNPGALAVAAVAAPYTQTVSVAVNSAAGGAVSWTVSCADSWVALGATNGTASGTLQIGLDLSRLKAGSYTSTLVFSDGSVSLAVPLSLSVEKMRIVKMATDWTKPYVYLAHTSDVSPYKSRLVWYNTGTDRIELVLDAGENATDLTVHYGDDRIYVSNWQRAETRVFDRSAKRELAPLLLGGDVYKLNALGPGRICCEGMDQWISVGLRGTADGSVKANLGTAREGDGEGTADGRLYYRCDNNISNAQLYKYAVTNDAFERTASVRTRSYYGSRNVVVSMDGSRVYNCGAVYDAGLRELLYLGSEIYAASAYGDLVVTGSKAVNGVSGAEVGTLPFSTSVMAFSGDQSKLLLFDAAAGSVTSLATSAFRPLPRPKFPCFAAPVTLSETNQIYTGAPRAVTARTVPANLSVVVTYNGSPTPPTRIGVYTVIATVSNDIHYGSATGTLTVTSQQTMVAFDPTPGTVDPQTKVASYGAAYGELPIPERRGYTFGGWWTGAAGTGTRVTEQTLLVTNVAHTLHAAWAPSQYTVTFDPHGGSVTPSSATVTFDSAYGALPSPLPPQPIRVSYAFAGWFSGTNGTESQVSENTIVATAENHTLFAKWTAAPYLSDSADGRPLTSSGQYTGYFYSEAPFDGADTLAVRGLFSLALGGTNRWFTGKALLHNRTLSFSANAWPPAGADGTYRAVVTASSGETLDLSVRQNRLWGSISGGSLNGEVFLLDGSRDLSTSPADAETAALLDTYEGYYTVALPPAAALPTGAAQAAPAGSGYLTMTVGRGGAKIAGLLADGTPFSQSAPLILFDGNGPEACVPLFVPLYARHGWIGGLLWLIPGGKSAVATDRDLGWFVRWEKPTDKADGASVLLDAVGGYYSTSAALASHYLFTADTNAVPYHYAGGTADLQIAALPDGIHVTTNRTGLVITNGTYPLRANGASGYSAENSAMATFAFTPKTGVFKGSFNLYYDYSLDGFTRHKTVRVPYAGVLTPTRGRVFADEPAGQGYYLVPDNDPAWRSSPFSRSYRITLEAAP